MPTSKRQKLIIAGVAGTLLLAGAAAGITAATSQEGTFEYFVQCFGDMIVNPDLHATECLPNRNATSLNSLSGPVTGTVPGVPTGPTGPTGPSTGPGPSTT